MVKVLCSYLIFASSLSHAMAIKCKSGNANLKLLVDMTFNVSVDPDKFELSERRVCDEHICTFDGCVCGREHLESTKIEFVIADGIGFIGGKPETVKLKAAVDFSNDLMLHTRGQSDSYSYLIPALTEDLNTFGIIGNPFILDTKTNTKYYIACKLSE